MISISLIMTCQNENQNLDDERVISPYGCHDFRLKNICASNEKIVPRIYENCP